ncbi:hypothetical protein ACLB2K_053639 [Fragaria x ananassa]
MSQFIVPHNEGSNCEQTATYGPVGGIDMSRFIVTHINEGSKVNCEQTAIYTPVGLSSGEDYYGDMFQFTVPDNEGSKVNSEQTATDSPVSVMPMFRGQVTGEGSYGEESQPSVPCNECSKEHAHYSYCPYVPCKVCYQLHHPAAICSERYCHEYIPLGRNMSGLHRLHNHHQCFQGTNQCHTRRD